MRKIKKHKKFLGKIIIVIILLVWFLSLLPGLILESRHIRQRYVQFGTRTPEKREEEVRRVEISLGGQGAGYMIIQKYIEELKNARNN